MAAGPQVLALSGGGDSARLEAEIEWAVGSRGVRGIISFGVAGGLAPGLAAGSCLVARAVVTRQGQRFETDRKWTQKLSASVNAPIVDVLGVDEAILHSTAKRALHVSTGAVAVDMESHIAARVAARHALPFAVFRVVADPAESQLPHAAMVGMRRDGTLAVSAVLRSLLRDPRQFPALMRTALDARAAFASLFRSRKMIAGGLGFSDLRELVLDVAREDVLSRSLPV